MILSPIMLVGLGNPGVSYAGNRHNIGFMVIDRVAQDYGLSRSTAKFGGLLSEGHIDGHRVYAFKPMGYMNASGVPVAQLAGFYKIPPERVIVLHDELDLEPGRIRVKTGGGHGGHNGLKSIDAHLGQDYKWVRIGIDHPGHKDRVADYVLSDFTKEEYPKMDAMVREISRHLAWLLAGDDAGFMNKIVTTLYPHHKE